jgi:hypothetical protein
MNGRDIENQFKFENNNKKSLARLGVIQRLSLERVSPSTDANDNAQLG